MPDIISDTPYREIYNNVPTAWGGQPGESIPRPQPSDFVKEYFQDKKDGFFIDVGASDGIIWSTTLGLEVNNNWTGICIEPHPVIFNELNKLCGITVNDQHYNIGRAAECIKVAISDKEGEADFLSFNGEWDAHMLSGLVDVIDPRQRERPDFSKHVSSAKVEKVQCKKLQTILDERKITTVNYLSIDAEGSEINVLNSINFDKVKFDLISVEVNYEQEPIDTILNKRGYKFVKKVCQDCFYEKS
tara:strand:- start:1929 stop:2663 length:735 start_codon:yes stop_codon:yes gene_type:complete